MRAPTPSRLKQFGNTCRKTADDSSRMAVTASAAPEAGPGVGRTADVRHGFVPHTESGIARPTGGDTMESGRIHRGFDPAVIPGDGPVAGNSSASRPHLRASRGKSSSALRGLSSAAGVIRSRLKLAVLAATCLVAGFLMQTNAWADSADEALARVRTLEREIAAIKQENEALRRVNKLREQNAALVKQTASSAARMAAVPASAGNPREAYAADMSIYAKAAAPIEQGRLRVWAEGGAIWSGGDPIDSAYTRGSINPTLGTLVDQSGFFPLVPKVGWEAATGFDYRFGGTPWHVSGQFRYGEGRTTITSGSSDSLSISAGGGPPTTFAISDSENVGERETHWLADFALGRDLIGTDALQFKFGTRIAELHATATSHESQIQQSNAPGGFLLSFDTNTAQELKFLGAGPRFGVEGSVPMAARWTFDYLGDIAALFGTQNFYRRTTTDNVVLIPNPGGLILPPPTIDTAQKFATVFNADIQVGVSYWMSQNLKASLSYRLDAYFNAYSGLDAKNDPKNLQQLNRYTHGPRLAVSAQF